MHMLIQQLLKRITPLLTINVCIHLGFSISVMSQENESLNKKELRSLCDYQKRKLDSLEIVLTHLENKLQSSQDELSENSRTIINLERNIVESLTNIQDLTSKNKECAISISEKNDIILSLEEQIKLANLQYLTLKKYSDSLDTEVLNKAEGGEVTRRKEGIKNWLDNLGFSGSPIPDGSLNFQFAGVISFNNYFRVLRESHQDGLVHGPIPFAPEVILADQLQFSYISQENYNSPVVISKKLSGSDFQAMMPTLEIIKGKVTTFKFSDGSEEDFLVTIKNIYNNGVLCRQLNFAHETAITKQTYGSNLDEAFESSKDLFYPVYEISGKKYICLNHNQLIRLKVPLSMVYLSCDENGKIMLRDSFGDYYSNINGHMDEIFLSRKTSEGRTYFLSHSDCFFLFSLNSSD